MAYADHMARRETLVQLTDELVAALDEVATRRSTSRSQLIRSVLEEFVGKEDEAEKERRLIEGYRRIPDTTPDDWGDLGAWSDWAAREADWPPWEEG